MTIEEKLENMKAYHRAEDFRHFMSDSADKIRWLMGQGYTKPEAIELLKVYALQGIAYALNENNT